MNCGSTSLIFLLVTVAAVAQNSTPDCNQINYANRNQIDYGPLRILAVRGTTKDSDGVAVPKVCVGVFTEADHKLIAVTSSNGSGYFELRKIPNGDYRLVAAYDGLAPANAKLRISRSGSKKLLTVQMRPAGLDTGSFVEVK